MTKKSGFKWSMNKNPALTSTEENLLKKSLSAPSPDNEMVARSLTRKISQILGLGSTRDLTVKDKAVFVNTLALSKLWRL